MVSRNDLSVMAQIAVDASAVILAVRARGFVSRTKADNSIVTEADGAAEDLIRARLARHWADIPLQAEEAMANGSGFDPSHRYFCVDPLDGTRDFASGGDDFTVNIALVEAGRPVAGVVHVCVTGALYAGLVGEGAWRADVRAGSDAAQADWHAIATRPYPLAGLTAVVSRSHLDPKTRALLDRPCIAESLAEGSSMKFCRVAEGQADLYPRFGPTMEWDTAAGHAILTAAGGCLLQPDGSPFDYGKVDSGFTNGPFLAWGRAPVSLDGAVGDVIKDG
ncbi:MAG: 3'(2'),5'-bisphosphate nucleotidase CysQ [Hyphomonadaceae bacterium]|jgi:3'(2'), 5'-bisphosphate nucleotidase|nr:3'(2'),5'-bisphosphate nucleotidase CysQ [Hyphomonadaceae bacterium]